MTVLTSEHMWAGREFAPYHFVVTPETASQYDAMFRDATGEGSFPTGYLAVLARESYLTEGEMPGGGVMATLEWSVQEPLPIGEPLAIRAVVTSRTERRGRPWIEIDSRVTDGDGRVLATTKVIGVWPS